MNKTQIIAHLGLEKHIEGGYFRRSYQSQRKESQESIRSEEALGQQADRRILTSIYYLLTDNSPIGHFHKNRSDIIHYFHFGAAIKYFIIHPNGELQTAILGHDLEQGQQLQLIVPGGCWKASQLISGEYGLLSEAVSPGFEYRDMQLATPSQMKRDFPDVFEQIKDLIKAT